ncbi:phosphodiester glycosidase family protein [Rhodococcoides kyotonense]|uniref:Uncharacterized protein n=1 Tax=Rhodococcoides kyotonense TaxID=398843 RepID=A0A239H321_9NOCA|nr:phosphodiester glycosidase family protein [Rhodococcus kyotonensis]SNS75876.1 Predicted protein [Rhodococcus kyotonensis]
MHTPTLPAPSPPSQISRREIRIWKILGIAALVLLSVATVSYVRALAAPGYATWNDKTSTWIRDHGGAPLLNAYENWRYATPPPDSQPTLPRPAASAVAGGASTSIGVLPVLPTTTGMASPTWIPGRTGTDGTPVSYTSLYQPDPAHRSAVAGVAIVSQTATTAHLVPGTTQPISDASSPASVPGDDVPSLVAAFNSGWKFSDISGGFYSHGTAARALQNGQASAVIDDSGHLRVVDWMSGSDVGPHVVAVRQNLALLVEHGSAAPGIESNGSSKWGSAKNQLQYTERSGLGIDARGNIVYVAAAKVDLATLARALVDAGAVTGMELDIHSGMTQFNSWTVDGAGNLAPSTLLPGVQSAPDRYLAPDRRDFFYITLDANR